MRLTLLLVMLLLTACTHNRSCPPMPDAAAMAAMPLGSSQDGSPPSLPVKSEHPSYIANPVYPYCAEDMNVTGIVDIVFTLKPDGSVGDFHVIQEAPVGFHFAAAAERVFGRWKFPPHLVDGKPVETQAFYRFSWKMS